MRQRERDSLATGQERDPHELLFGDDGDYDDAAPARLTRADRRRSDQARRRRVSRRGWIFVLLTVLVVGGAAYAVAPKVVDLFSSRASGDYASTTGDGRTVVTVTQGDTAADIAKTLYDAGVVKSEGAFTDAADANPKSQTIQPGRYSIAKHISADAALATLLDPTSRTSGSTVLVPEGATSMDVESAVAKCYGSASAPAIASALKSTAELGVPTTYKTGTRFPASVEGFLYPATYTCDPTTTPRDALTAMVLRFVSQDRQTGFADAAQKLHITPYQALIVASIAQSEAKYPEDMPKVARTILNRIASKTPLQFDSTSSYGCKLLNIPADKCQYAQVDSPYNTYTHDGLPPTPIDNPGAEAMDAAVNPAKGNWLFFVNQDKAGHLFFTNDDKAFQRAVKKCAQNNWGCAG